MTQHKPEKLRIDDLSFAPSQVWGNVRIVPVLRAQPITGLRLHRQCIEETVATVLDGSLVDPKTSYLSYVPHAFVVRWSDAADSSQAYEASYGTKLLKQSSTKRLKHMPWMPCMHRMARRESGGLRFLPLHLAMEGFLSLHFGGPTHLWREYSDQVMRKGLSPRIEWSLRGTSIPDLQDALRVFEIHEHQVGVLLFVGDVLASAFILPRHDEYRQLHSSLLTDFFGDTLLWHSLGYREVPDWKIDTSHTEVNSLADLSAFLEQTREQWSEFHASMAGGLFEHPLESKQLFRLGRFSLRRFLPSFDPEQENHLGEMIVDESGQLAYLKTFRLSAAQARRGYLLKTLSENDWSLEACAASLNMSRRALILRLKNAGFEYLLKPHIIADAEHGL